MRVPRDTIPCPRPAPAVVVVLRRPVDVPARLVHHRGALVAEVLVVGLEGPDGQELPEDLVGFAAADLSLMGEEHEVQLSLPVKLEDPKDGHPTFDGLRVAAALDQGPIGREAVPDPDEVPVLVKADVAMPPLLQDPEGPELDMARGLVVLWQSCCCGRSSTVVLSGLPPLWAAGHRRCRRRARRYTMLSKDGSVLTRDVSNVAARHAGVMQPTRTRCRQRHCVGNRECSSSA